MRTSTLTALAALSADQDSLSQHKYLGHHRHHLRRSYSLHHSPALQSGYIDHDHVALRRMTFIGRGGGATLQKSNSDEENNSDISLLGISLTPRALSTLSMALCMSLHYLAYSLARPATMTLFTSSRLGFGNNSVSAYPFAMTFISPMYFILLLFYGNVLNGKGPYMALKTTTLGCAVVLGACSLLIAKLDPYVESKGSIATLTKYIIGTLFVFRESYVQLITSQHWSFISSVLTPNQSSRWFAPISGLTSVTSAFAAMGVGRLVGLWGLTGVLGVAAVVLGASVIFGEMAYSIAEKVSISTCFCGLDFPP